MEALFSLNWTTFGIFCVTFYCTYVFWSRRRLPPGPLSLPVVGSVGFLVKLSNGLPHKAFAEASRIYGEIVGVWVGPKLLVVLNGYDVIHQAFVKQAPDLNDRPNWIFKQALKEGKGVSWSNGTEWQQIRKFSIQSMKDFGMKKDITEERILEEIDILEEIFERTNGNAFAINKLMQCAVSNIISVIVFGKRFDYDDEAFQNLLNTLDFVVKGSFTGLQYYIPSFLLPLFPKAHRIATTFIRSQAKTKSLVYQIIEDHEKTFDPNNIRDFIDLYIQTTKAETESSECKYLHKGNIWRIIYDLFLAGSETTSTALEWAFLFMIEYPDIQRKCQDVIGQRIGNRRVILSDRSHLAYIEAVLHEVLRLSNVTPMGVPRTNVNHDVTINGYTIPRYTIVLANLYSTNVDPKYWRDPFVFNPDRFLDSEGKLTRQEAFSPFSLGPRLCLGESLARMELFLYFANLLQKFSFEREDNVSAHDFSTQPGQAITLSPKHFKLKARKRD